ncbi:MAG: cyclodeaminase [Gammaproteobacteria bacterium]|nr:cyclodeaminase [Gammaproteobacteria bacterium]
MPEIAILDERDLRKCVALDNDAVECVENCFRALAGGAVVMPPILRLDIAEHNGELDVKTAYIPGVDSFAVKMSPGFFDNPKLGLPSVNGLMVLLSARTGLVEALLLDNGYLTDVRTAAAGAVAAKWLAREDTRSVAVIGAGVQAKLQVQALTLVRPVEQVRVWARDTSRAEQCAAQMRDELQLDVSTAPAVSQAVDGVDIIVTTTPSVHPLLRAVDLSPGQHITAMGSDAEHKNEIAADVFNVARYYCDRLSQVRVLGELHHAIVAGVCGADDTYPELGEVVAGNHDGRCSTDEITVCDLTGTGAQDTAIATLARQRAQSAGLGSAFSTG